MKATKVTLPSQSELDCRINYTFKRKSIDTLAAQHQKQIEQERTDQKDHAPTQLEKEHARALAYAKDCKDSGEQWWVYQYATEIADALGIKPEVKRFTNKQKLPKDYTLPASVPTIEIRRAD